jgi:hypothetical protein
MRMIAAVWVDGILQSIPEISGGFTDSPNILNVDSGLAGDPHAWAALGWDSGRVFALRSDGVIHEFYVDDPDNFGLSIGFAPTIRHFSADVDSLNLVTYEFSLPGITQCFGCDHNLTPIIRGHVFSIPLSGSSDTVEQFDLNGDQHVTAADALIVINAINGNPDKRLTELPELRQAVPKIDTDGDGELSPSDALTIINYLNRNLATPSNSVAPAPEGEASADQFPSDFASAADEYFASLSAPKRKR